MTPHELHTFEPHEDDDEFVGVVDMVRPGRALLAAVFVFCFALFGLRQVGLGSIGRRSVEPQSLAEVEAIVGRLAHAEASRRVIFLGDSVLGDSVLLERLGPDYRDTDVVGAARSLVKVATSVEFARLALDGALPKDIERLVRTITAADPNGSIDVVLELTPRYLSRAYMPPDRAYSRNFLAPPEPSGGLFRFLPRTLREAAETIRLPKHRFGLIEARLLLPDEWRLPRLVFREAPRPFERGRIAPHFLDTVGDATNPQAAALQNAVIELARAPSRRIVSFTTPLNRDLIGGTREAVEAAESVLLDLSAAGAPPFRVRLHADDGSFDLADFLDHCHLTPAGNRRLAARLLNALEIPNDGLPRIPQLHGDLDADVAWILGGGGIGKADGFGDAFRISAKRSMAAIDTERLLLTDEAEGAIRVIDIPRRRSRTIYEPMGRETPGPESRPRAFAPREMTADRRGGAFFLDALTGAVHTVDSALEVAASTKGSTALPWRGQFAQLAVMRGRPIVAYGSPPGLFDENGKRLAVLDITEDLTDFAMDDNGRGIAVAKNSGVIGFGLPATPSGDRIPVFVLAPKDLPRARVVYDNFAKSAGIVGETHRLPIAGLANPTTLACSGDGRSGLVLDDAQGMTVLWRFEFGAVPFAYPLSIRDRRGLAMAPGGKGIRRFDSVLAAAPNGIDCFLMTPKASQVFALRASRSQRASWIYGNPPIPEGNPAALNGATIQPPEARDYRLALFGSSIAGAIGLPQELAAAVSRPTGGRGLAATLSVATALEDAVRSTLADFPRRIDVANWTVPLATLVHTLATLHDADPALYDLAVVTLDGNGGLLVEPAKRPRLVDHWARLERESDGTPRIAKRSSFIPDPVLADGDQRTALPIDAVAASLVDEIVDLCRARRTPVVFLNVGGLSNPDGSGVAKANVLIDLMVSSARARAVERGAPFIDASDVGRLRSGSEFPLSLFGDGHLDAPALALAAWSASVAVRDAILADVFLNPRLAEGRSLRPRRAVIDPRPFVPGPKLPADIELLRIDPSAVDVRYVDGRWHLDVDQTVNRTVAAWRLALAAVHATLENRTREGDALSVRIVRFRSRDEYGLGKRNDVGVVADFTISKEDWMSAQATFAADCAMESAPKWLVQVNR